MSLKANAMDYCITKEWISKFDILTHHGRPIFSRFMARVAQIYSCNTTFISVDDYENFMNTRIGVDPSDNNSQRCKIGGRRASIHLPYFTVYIGNSKSDKYSAP